MQGWATLPDGTKQWLLFIKQWDFNWQGDYRYAQPIFLPKGSVLSMRYTYDNSTNNVLNPNHPPKPVNYGLQSSDEMAELWFQLLPRNATDLAALEHDYQKHLAGRFREHDEFRLRKDPNNADAHLGLGLVFLTENNVTEAERHFRAAVQAKPDLALAHYRLGLALRLQKKLTEARAQFEEALRLNPQDFQAHGNLGFVLFDLGDPEAAQAHFEAALRLNPDDAVARDALNEILKARGRPTDRR
jgi:tetratricopeptide (TPR) repeat protein